jgi:hypothetical protein
MILKKLPQITKIAWTGLLISSFVISGWSQERATIGFLIVVASWVGVRIITESLEAAIDILKPKTPPRDDASTDGWTKDNW